MTQSYDEIIRTTPFNPPYALTAQGAVFWGIWPKSERLPFPEVAVAAGFKPLRFLGRSLTMTVVMDYDPPPAHPVAYREVIAAVLARRGVRLVVVALSLYLDNEFHVALGRHYYHLPKHLDASLRVQMSSQKIDAAGERLSLFGRLRKSWWTYPLEVLATASVRVATRVLPVIGASEAPAKEALLTLTPSFDSSCSLADTRIKLPLGSPWTFWAQSWRHIDAVVNTVKDVRS